MSRLAVLVLIVAVAGCSGSRPTGGFGATPRPDPETPAQRARPPALPTPRPPMPALPEATLSAPSAAAVASAAWVRPLDAPELPSQGLFGRHIAVWPSHGWYYESRRGGWEWQRAHLFTTIEDVLPFSIVAPYLAPMLERAGAVVLMPRERDTQTDELVIDADTPRGSERRRGDVEEEGDWRPGGVGFGHLMTIRGTQNPFTMGTDRVAETSITPTARTVWTPDIRTPGEYAVTVAYTAAPDRATDARYVIQHAGGTTRVAVNQRIGGGTWVRLGTFRFAPGRARVTLSNESAVLGRTVSADAVRFGGGMGSVQRAGETGGRPRWTEGARYYEQFAGAPESVYSPERADRGDDYKDDYKGRAEWVNWLLRSGVPVDLSLALHTDAGITTDSTAVGTLAIYHARNLRGDRTFPDGRSRTLNRDVAARIQGQIVSDLRALYDPRWTQRELRNRDYSEAARPDVPAALIEMLSHQNLTDMRFALDPRFRFDLARAIYKGAGRVLAAQDRTQFVVQPLAPAHLTALFDAAGNVAVAWQPTADPVEPSARSERYRLYTRRGEGGWDAGRLVAGTEAVLVAPPPGEVLSVRVAALNAGGESAPSEALAVGRSGPPGPPVLVVAGFDRVSAPEITESPVAAGVRGDEGVPDGVDLAYTGAQTDFDPRSVYRDDDRPGHGASRDDATGRPVAGNTHDFVAVHGRALLASGRSFVSASDEAVEDGTVALVGTVDLLLGEERTTAAPGWRPVRGPDFEALPAAMRARLAAFVQSGGKLIVSGAHWAGDAARSPGGADFLRDVLGVRAAPAASSDGTVEGPMLADPVAFNTVRRPDLYAVEATDGIEAAGDGVLALRVARTGAGAGVVRRGRTVALSFPIEALLTEDDRAAVVAAALAALE